MTNNPEIIIIGAGPAGLMAARELHKNNINFLCIDKKKEIGFPLQCGEGVRENAFKKFFKHTNYQFVNNKIKNNDFYVFKNDKYKKRTIQINYLQIDRPQFEKWLAKDFKKNILLNHPIYSIKKEGDKWLIKTQDNVFYSKMIILANGPHFHFQKSLGLIKEYKNIAIAYGGIYSNVNKNINNSIFSFSDEIPLGYFWYFPKKNNCANIGFSCPSNIKDIKKILPKLIKNFTFLKYAKQEYNYGGIVPVNGPIPKIYDDALLVAGDAAGFVNPFSGEGIKFALESGKLAGETATKAIKKHDYSKNILKEYETKCKNTFYSELKAGLLLRDIFYFIVKKYPKLLTVLITLPSKRQLKDCLQGKIPLSAKILHKIIKNKIPEKLI